MGEKNSWTEPLSVAFSLQPIVSVFYFICSFKYFLGTGTWVSHPRKEKKILKTLPRNRDRFLHLKVFTFYQKEKYRNNGGFVKKKKKHASEGFPPPERAIKQDDPMHNHREEPP